MREQKNNIPLLKKFYFRNMIQRRSDAGACALNGKMYVAGGYTGELVLQTVEIYNPENDTWVQIATMDSPRSGIV